jgi:hypothetical protein
MTSDGSGSGTEQPTKNLSNISESDNYVSVLAVVLTAGKKEIMTRGEKVVLTEGELADETGRCRYVAWEGFNLEEGDTVRIDSAVVRSSPVGPEINLKDETTVHHVDEDLDINAEIGGEIPLKELRRDDSVITIEGKILEAESKSIDSRTGETEVIEGVIGDETAKVLFIDWESRSTIREGVSVRIKNAFSKSKDSAPAVDINEYSTVQSLNEEIEVTDRKLKTQSDQYIDFEKALTEATGSSEAGKAISTRPKQEIQSYLYKSLQEKLLQDNVLSSLWSTAEKEAKIPDLDDPPEKPSPRDQGPIRPDCRGVTVRRYLDTSKFVSLLQSGIWLNRLDNFSDDFEGTVSDKLQRIRYDLWEYGEFEGTTPPFDSRNMDAAKDKLIQKQSFVSCWRYGGIESAVFWEAYIDNGDGVAVETTLNKLQSALNNVDRDVLIGKMNYRRYKGSDETFGKNPVKRVFHKRFAFDDEKELRLLSRKKINDISIKQKRNKKFDVEFDADIGFNLDINPNDLISRVILPPGVNNREISRVVNIIEYHDIDAEVWRSILDVDPKATAPVDASSGEVVRDDMKRQRIIDKSEYS